MANARILGAMLRLYKSGALVRAAGAASWSAGASGPRAALMTDLPGVLLTATIWAYWFGVGLLIVRARRQTHRLPGVVPEQRLEQFMWIGLAAAGGRVDDVAVSGARAQPRFCRRSPAFARDDPGYAALRWIAAGCALACLLLTSLCWSHMGRHWRMAVRARR